MCSTGSTGDVLQQMSKLWSMLDDLSENDPAAYRTLIEKQIKEGAEFRAPPELDSCLCTEILVSFIREGSFLCRPQSILWSIQVLLITFFGSARKEAHLYSSNHKLIL